MKSIILPGLALISKHDVDGSENVIWKCNFAFLQHFAIIQSQYAWKMSATCHGINLEPALEDKTEHWSSYAHVVHTTAKQIISRHRKNENVFKMSKDEKCTCKACKNTVFHCQIWKFVGFLLPSSSWLLELPIKSKIKRALGLLKKNLETCFGTKSLNNNSKETNA